MDSAEPGPVCDRDPRFSWRALEQELDQWQACGRSATFWWRDDDACVVTQALERLIELSDMHRAPLVLATIPAHTDTGVAWRVTRSSEVMVAQHGHAHVDLSAGERPGHAELDAEIDDESVRDRVERGQHRMVSLFDDRFVPMLVPPWNRISESMYAGLPELGFRAVSTFGPREWREPVAGVRQVNTHCDIIDWKGGARFRGARRVQGDIVEHLHQRRTGIVDGTEPTGLLTHHLDHDEHCWWFLDQLLERLVKHPATRFLGREVAGQ